MTANLPTAVFRFDASRIIGAGHAMRSGALASALAEAGWRTVCATREETIETVPVVLGSFDEVLRLGTDETREVDEIATRIARPCQALVLDHYGRDRAFASACRRIAPCIAVIEDRSEAKYDCDILVNPCTDPVDAPQEDGMQEALRGPRHALLRPAFRAARAQAEQSRERGSLLLLGGYADRRNVTGQLFNALDGSPEVETIHVVLGAANVHRARMQDRLRRAVSPTRLHVDPPRLVDLMCRVTLAVTAAGSTCWELACLGAPMVTVVTADNQIAVERRLRDAGASATAGAVDASLYVRLRETVATLMADDARLRRMALCGRALVDGLGAKRVARAIQARTLLPKRNVA